MSSPHFSSDRRGSETRARVKSPYARKAKRGGLAFSPTPLPFSLPPYPLPLSTPATQATANALHSSGMGGSTFPGALRQELYSLCKDLSCCGHSLWWSVVKLWSVVKVRPSRGGCLHLLINNKVVPSVFRLTFLCEISLFWLAFAETEAFGWLEISCYSFYPIRAKKGLSCASFKRLK